MRLHPVIRRICASLATVFYISTSAAIGKTIEVYDVDDMLKACTNKAGGPFELILHNDIGVTGKNSDKKWTSEKSLYYRSNYTIKSASDSNYSVSFTGGNVSQLQEAFDLCDEVVFENLHNVTLGNCSDIASSKDFNDALSSGYDSETGALMNIDHVIFKDLTGKLQLSSLSFYSGGMGGDGMNAATATVSGIGLACSTAEFLNVANGIEIKNIQVFDKITTWYPWQRWIEMSGVALCAKDVTFADNGTSIVFSGNFIEQARENKMEGMGQGAAAYITGTANFNNNAGSLTFSENHLNMATVGCGAALFLGTFSETTITGQHRDEAAGIDALISFSGNYVDILQNDGSQLTTDLCAYGGAVCLGYSANSSDEGASLSITDNDCNVIFQGNYIHYYLYEVLENEHLDVLGGAVYVDSKDSLSITRNHEVEFSDNYIKLKNEVGADGKRRNAFGGALYLGSGATAEFTDNEGGVIFSNNSVITQGFDVKGHGGAIYVGEGASLLLKDYGADNPNASNYGVAFKNNQILFDDGSANYSLDGRGGAIYAAAGSKLSGDMAVYCPVDFQDNSAAYGGALYLENGVTLGINSMYFGSNSAKYGGAVYVEGSILLSQDDVLYTWAQNKADAGGAVYIAKDASLNISGKNISLYFHGNETDYLSGGAISADGDFTVSDVIGGEIEFMYNKTASMGGAVNATYGHLEFKNNDASLTFAYNEASGDGGAIYYFDNTDTPDFGFYSNAGDISFHNNIAGIQGGAIYGDDVTFLNNTAKISFLDNQSAGHGSAILAWGICIEGNQGKIVFSGNESLHASGAITALDYARINGNTGKIEFSRNRAVYGAALTHVSELCSNTGTIVFKNNVVNESADSTSEPSAVGGAIYVGLSYWNHIYKSLQIAGNTEDIIFTLNRANGTTAKGGAIYVDSAGSISFEGNGADIQFTGNRSGYYGGAIAINNANLTITGTKGTVLFEDNHAEYAGGAIAAIGKDSKVSITDNAAGVIFRNNTAEAGSAISSEGCIEIRNNGNVLFQGGTVSAINLVSGAETQCVLNLSAPEGASITFDNTDIKATRTGNGIAQIYFNEDYMDKPQSGDIIFRGADSSSTFLASNITLFNGRLELNEGSSISLEKNFISYSTVELFDGALLNSGVAVKFHGGELNVYDSQLKAGTLSLENSSARLEKARYEGTAKLTEKSSLTLLGSNLLRGMVHLNDSFMTITGNDSGLTLSRNLDEYPESPCEAVYAEVGSIITLSNNKGDIRIVGNESEADGGAFALHNSELRITDNTGTIIFEDNKARYGGAVAALGRDSRVSIVDNDADVVFRNNTADEAASILSEGCVEICNNGNVLFECAPGHQAVIHMRVSEDAVYGQDMLILSAAEGKTITFDNARIYIETSDNRNLVDVKLNNDYGNTPQSGTILFTNGSTASFKRANQSLANGLLVLEKKSKMSIGNDFTASGDIILTGESSLTVGDQMGIAHNSIQMADSEMSANHIVGIQVQMAAERSMLSFGKTRLAGYSSLDVAEQSKLTVTGDLSMELSVLSLSDGSSLEGCQHLKLTDSQLTAESSVLSVGEINLDSASSMYLVDGSTLKGNSGFVLEKGTSLMLRDASVERTITLNNDTALKVQGFNTVSNLAADKAHLIFNIGAEHNATTAALTFTVNTSMILDPALLDVTADDPLTSGRYALLSTGYSESGWVAGYENVVPWTNGFLSWDEGTLYWTVTGLTKYTWCNEAGDMKWSTTSANWSTRGGVESHDNIVTHEDGHIMYFGDEGAGEVHLVGELKPGHVTVYNSQGNKYTFSGTGSLSGETKLTKKGTGTLTIATENSYTGGTNIYGGILEAAHDSALGYGLVTLYGGVLNISTSIDNTIRGLDMGGRVLLGTGTTLKATQIDADNENLILIGSGTYNLGDTLDGGLRAGVTTGTLWRGTVSATHATLTAGEVDTTTWKNTELNGTTTISGGSLTLGGNVVLNGQIANSGTLLMGGNITVNQDMFDAVTLASGCYQQGNSLAATGSGFLSGGSISMVLVTGTAAGLSDSAPEWNVQGYNTYDFDGNTLYATADPLGEEFCVNANDTVTYNGSSDTRFTNYENKRATSIALHGGTLKLNNSLEDNLGIRAEADSTVHIGKAANLDAGELNTNGKQVTLSGVGVYTLEKQAGAPDAGVVFGTDWSGTVKVPDVTYDLELDKLGASGSRVELGDFEHTLAERDQSVVADLSSTGLLRHENCKLELSGTNTLSLLVVDSLSIAGGSTSIDHGLTLGGECSVAAGAGLSIAGSSSLSGTITLETGGTLTLAGTILVNQDTFTPEEAVKDVLGYFIGSATKANDKQSGFEAACWDITIASGGTIIDKGVTWVLETDENADFKFDKDGTLHAYGSGVGRVFYVGAEDSVTYSKDNADDFVNRKGQQASTIQLNGGRLNLERNVGDKNTQPFIISSTASELNIGADVMLKGSQLDATAGAVTLSGKGGYDLETGLSLGEGVLLSEDWQGLVYTGTITEGTESLSVGHLGNMNSGVQLGQKGDLTVGSLNATDADTGSTVGTVITPGNLTLQIGTSDTNSLTVEGVLALGTDTSAVTLNADAVLSTKTVKLGNIASTVFAGALGEDTLNISITDELLKKHTNGSITIVTLANAYNGTTTLNGVNAGNGVRSTDWKMIYTLVWQDSAEEEDFARTADSSSELRLLADTNPEYVKQKVGVTVHNYSHNGSSGLEILNVAYAELNPQLNTPGSALSGLIDIVDAGKMTDEGLAAVAGASTTALGQALSGDVERQLRAIRNRSTTGAYGHDAVAMDSKGGSLCQPGKYFAWVNAESNRAEQNADGTAAGYTLTSWGGTVGAGMQATPQLTLGMALTAMYGELQSDGPDSLKGDMDTTYLSAFARYQRRNWSHSIIGTVGTMDADYKRSAMGYSNDGDTDGSAFGLMYELSRDYALSNRSSISPVFNISYRHTKVNSYSERGADAALNVGEQSLDTVTVGLGARYAATMGQQTFNRACVFEARALAKYDVGDTQTDTSAGFINQATRANIESAEMGSFGLELGAGISVPVGRGSIFADGAVELRSDYTNINASAGYRIQF